MASSLRIHEEPAIQGAIRRLLTLSNLILESRVWCELLRAATTNRHTTDERRTLEICAFFSLIVRAMVSQQDEVFISPAQQGTGVTTLFVEVLDKNLGRLIGQGERIAGSLRAILVACISEHGGAYQLDLNKIVIPADALIRG